MEMEINGPKIVFTIPGIDMKVTETIILGWLVILLVTVFCLIVTSNLKKKPETKRQMLAELVVNFVNDTVKSTMGDRFLYFSPYVAMILCYAGLGSLISMLGLRAVTADFNTPLTLALMTFILITFFKVKTNGVFGYFKSFTQPIAVITPINILSEIATPVSMSVRLFGNVSAGTIITMLLYMGLTYLSNLIHLPVPALAVGIPAVLSAYFDLFSGCIQAYVFSMLTMVNVGSAAESD